jgi:hypothetical protein
LLAFICDDFTRLHLSPERPNFLQPFGELLRHRVLVIGSSIGPVARFVAEQGAEVDAVEPDFVHAALAATRCRDLNNVRSYIGDYSSGFPSVMPYDVIVATAPSDASVNLESCLGRLRSALAASGLLIVAVNNSLGISTLVDAGAGAFGGCGAGWTLSKAAADEIFAAADFQDVRLFCAFPSPEFCRLIIGSNWSGGLPVGFEDILSDYDGRSPMADGRFRFQSIWKSVLENGLLTHLSNSFVITASLQALPQTDSGEVRIYSSLRRKHFAKVAVIHAADGEATVSRRPLFPDAPPPPGSLFHTRSYDEPYFIGRPYLSDLQKILDREGWQPEDIAIWARRWLDLLDASSFDESFLGYIGGITSLRLLPQVYVDCIPHNIRVGKHGELFPIDFEYETVAPIPLNFVVFRGLWHALSSVTAAHPPQPAFANIPDLALEVMRLAGMPLNEDEVRNHNRIEAALQNSVVGAPLSQTEVGLRSSRLRVREVDPQPPAAAVAAGDTVRVFWKTADSQYDESASAAAAITPGRDRQLICVAIPPIDPPPDSLRLDPCTRPGVFYLFSLRLFDALGECIWAWDGDRTHFVKKRFLAFADIPFQSGTVAFSEGVDPSLDVPVRREVLPRLRHGGRLKWT